MSTEYENWQKNPEILAVLDKLGLGHLDHKQQLLLVNSVYMRSNSYRLHLAINAFHIPKGLGYKTIDTIRQVVEATRFNTVGSGANPYSENEQTNPNLTSD